MEELPPFQSEALALLPSDKPIVLFARHSIRESEPSGTLASYQLPLTDRGIELARYWGNRLNMPVRGAYSSPVARCVDTAQLMIEPHDGAKEVTQVGHLMEPGCFVRDMRAVGQLFLDLGPVKFVAHHLQTPLTGMATAPEGTLMLLEQFRRSLGPEGSLTLHISHDTILAGFMYCLLEKQDLIEEDWPKMMEGVFLWFDEDDDTVHWIWRGERGSRELDSLREALT